MHLYLSKLPNSAKKSTITSPLTYQHNDYTENFIHSSLQLILRVLNHQIAASCIARLVSPTISRHCQADLISCSQYLRSPFNLKRFIVSSPREGVYEVTAIYSMAKRSIALTGRICQYDTLLWTEMDILSAIPQLRPSVNP